VATGWSSEQGELKMRCILAGNERIGYECLKILIEEKQQIIGVVTDNSNSKTKLENSRIKFLAKQAGIKLYETEDINNPDFLEELRQLQPDVLFNIAFLQLYKPPALAVPRLGCINFHPGPLPRYGGSNGWVWAIIHGESEYGVTFHYMKEKIDTGHIIGLDRFRIEKDETGLSLLIKCYEHGAALFRKTLADILEDAVVPVPQDLSLRSYYYNKVPYEGMIDTTWNASEICDFVRAMDFSPFRNPLSPAMVTFNDARLIVRKARMLGSDVTRFSEPGEVIDMNYDGVVIQTRDGLVQLTLSEPSMPSANTASVCAKVGINKGSVLGSKLRSHYKSSGGIRHDDFRES
jgi:methionyl-tRNA formyltransferase